MIFLSSSAARTTYTKKWVSLSAHAPITDITNMTCVPMFALSRKWKYKSYSTVKRTIPDRWQWRSWLDTFLGKAIVIVLIRQNAAHRFRWLFRGEQLHQPWVRHSFLFYILPAGCNDLRETPFRLTRMLIDAMEATGIEVTYRRTCCVETVSIWWRYWMRIRNEGQRVPSIPLPTSTSADVRSCRKWHSCLHYCTSSPWPVWHRKQITCLYSVKKLRTMTNNFGCHLLRVVLLGIPCIYTIRETVDHAASGMKVHVHVIYEFFHNLGC